MRVRTQKENGELMTVWELSDTSIFADSEWMIGQVAEQNVYHGFD